MKDKLEEKFMIQWLYADDTQDVTLYMNREEMINRFGVTFPFVKSPDFEQCEVTVDIVTTKIIRL